MINLFDVVDGFVEIAKEARVLEPFKAIINADKGSEGDAQARKKLIATKELAFVYFHSKFDSPYMQYDGLDRILKVQAHVGLGGKWKPSKLVQDACTFFEELQRTKSMKYLDSVQHAVDNLSDYLANVNVAETIESGPKKGELVHDINKVKTLAKDMPDMIEALAKTKELVRKEMSEEAQLRSGRKVNNWTE
jgi:hypothetical protein